MAYFVVYEHVIPPNGRRLPSNVILRKSHPVVWAANPPSVAREQGIDTHLRWWIEIPDALADDPAVQKWCGIED